MQAFSFLWDKGTLQIWLYSLGMNTCILSFYKPLSNSQNLAWPQCIFLPLTTPPPLPSSHPPSSSLRSLRRFSGANRSPGWAEQGYWRSESSACRRLWRHRAFFCHKNTVRGGQNQSFNQTSSLPTLPCLWSGEGVSQDVVFLKNLCQEFTWSNIAGFVSIIRHTVSY